MVDALERLPDFYLEMEWKFDSSFIPLVCKVAPSDCFKVWKYGTQLRLDTTLVGWKKLRSKRRDISTIFRAPEFATKYNNSFLDKQLFVVNRSKEMLLDPTEELDSDEIELIVKDVLRADPIQGDVKMNQYTLVQEKN